MDANTRRVGTARAAPWPGLPWWALLVFVWCAGAIWCGTFERLAGAAAAASPTLPHGHIPNAALVGVAIQFATTALETAWYRAWWWRAGRTLPYLRALVMLLQVSLFECLALRLLAGGAHADEPWRIWLAGPRVAWVSGAPDGVAFALGGFGLLAALRLALTAEVQVGAARASRRSAFAVTLGAWLATRVALLCAFDLARGRSSLG